MPIYTNIKKTCKQKGISVTKLEADLGFARSTIYKWDTHQPGIGKLKKVSDYLGVTMECVRCQDTIIEQGRMHKVNERRRCKCSKNLER